MRNPITKDRQIVGLEQWENVICEAFSPMTFARPLNGAEKDFGAELSTTELNGVKLSCVGSDAIKVSRSVSDISKAVDHRFLVKFQLRGEGYVRHCHREAHLKPGDFVLCSSSEPYQLEFPADYQQAVIAVPSEALSVCKRNTEDLLGLRMSSASPLHNILGQFVVSLLHHGNDIPPNSMSSLASNLIDLLVTSLDSELELAPQKASNQQLKLVKRFIHLNIKNPRMSPSYIAEAEGISKRYLHMLFEAEEASVSQYIMQLRLDGCRESLSSERMQGFSVTDIAMYWGFNEMSHFHRFFKSRYCLTPRQHRVEAKKSWANGAKV